MATLTVVILFMWTLLYMLIASCKREITSQHMDSDRDSNMVRKCVQTIALCMDE